MKMPSLKKSNEMSEWIMVEESKPAEDLPSVFEKDGLPARFRKADKKERFQEFIRVKFNFRAVTTLMFINVLILMPLGFVTWLMNTLALADLAPLNKISWYILLVIWIIPYLTWHYSTITIPVKDGPKIKYDWSKTTKGRKLATIFSVIPFHIVTWALAAKYTTEKFVPYLSSVQVQEQFRGLLLTDDLNSLILILYVAPVLISIMLIFYQVRDYMINKDLLDEHFMEWEAPYFTRFAHEYKLDTCDIIVGYEIDTGKPIVIKESQRFLHEGIIGATGSGKTSTTLLLRAAQDLKNIATGRVKMGLVFLEPKGDAIDDILHLAKKFGIPDEKIMVIDPTKADQTIKYNPFSGHREVAAMSFQGTLNALTGDQDEFFKGQQNEAAQIYTLLAKIRYGNATNVTHIQNMFMDARYLADIVEQVRRSLEIKKKAQNLDSHEAHEIASIEMIVSYFENQVLDYKETRSGNEFTPILYPADHPRHANKQMVVNKKEQFITGAKKYLNEIALNSMLKSLFVSQDGEKTFDADEFLLNGGVLLVNTALPDLEELSLMFGQFFIRQFQSAIFRRPKDNRIPVYFYIDEFPLYVNEAFERILTLGRSYRVGALIAMQSIAQLESAGKHLRESILGNASHKTVFGRGPVNDNKYFSDLFGEKISVEESLNESASPMTSEKQTWGYRFNTQKKLVPRFTASDISGLKFKEMIVQIVDDTNSIDVAVKARGCFVNEAKFISNFLDLKEEDIKSNKMEDFNTEEFVPREKLSSFVTGAIEHTANRPGTDDAYTIEELETMATDETEALEFEPSQPSDEINFSVEEIQRSINESNELLEKQKISQVIQMNQDQIKGQQKASKQMAPPVEPLEVVEETEFTQLDNGTMSNITNIVQLPIRDNESSSVIKSIDSKPSEEHNYIETPTPLTFEQPTLFEDEGIISDTPIDSESNEQMQNEMAKVIAKLTGGKKKKAGPTLEQQSFDIPPESESIEVPVITTVLETTNVNSDLNQASKLESKPSSVTEKVNEPSIANKELPSSDTSSQEGKKVGDTSYTKQYEVLEEVCDD